MKYPKDELTYLRLRKAYLTHPNQRPIIFEELWDLFGNKGWVTKTALKKGLSLLETKADFCLAIDRLIVEKPKETSFEDVTGSLKTYYWLEVKKDLEENQGLWAPLMRGLKWRRKSNDGKDIPKKGLEKMKIMYDLDTVERFKNASSNTSVEFKEQEVNVTACELKEFVLDQFCQEDWEDYVNHFMHGEPLRHIAVYRKVAWETIRYRTNKVQKAVRNHFNWKKK